MSRLVEIGDSAGKSFRMYVEVTMMGSGTGWWQALDKGYIRFNSGYNRQEESIGTLCTTHAVLFSEEGTWGIRLNDFKGFWGPNKEGNGLLLSPWAITIKPDVISWILID